MPAHPARRFTAVLDVLDEYMPTPARLLLVAVVLAIGLCVAGTTWPPLDSTAPSEPAAVVVITPDDPAAPTPVPASQLGR